MRTVLRIIVSIIVFLNSVGASESIKDLINEYKLDRPEVYLEATNVVEDGDSYSVIMVPTDVDIDTVTDDSIVSNKTTLILFTNGSYHMLAGDADENLDTGILEYDDNGKSGYEYFFYGASVIVVGSAYCKMYMASTQSGEFRRAVAAFGNLGFGIGSVLADVYAGFAYTFVKGRNAYMGNTSLNQD